MKPKPQDIFYDWLAEEYIAYLADGHCLPDVPDTLSCDTFEAFEKLREMGLLEWC